MSDLGQGRDDRLVSAPYLTVIAVAFFSALGFASTLPLVAQYVSTELGRGDLEIGIAVGVFSFSAVAVRPFIGRLGDERGRRFLILGGCSATAVVLAAHALADTYEVLLLARILMGAVQGGFFVGTVTLVNDLAPEHRRGEAASYFSIAIYGGMAFGPLVGERVMERFNFDIAFLAAAASMGIAALISWFLPPSIPPPAPAGSRPEMTGRFMLDEPARKPPRIYPAAVWPGVILAMGIVTFPAMQGFMPKVMEENDLGEFGSVFLVYGVLVLVFRVAGRKLPDQLGTGPTAAIALVGASLGMLSMAVFVSRPGFYFGAVVLAVGGSFLYPALMIAAVEGVPANERARAMGTFTMFFELSGGVGAPILGLIAFLTNSTIAAFYGGAVFAAAGLPLLIVWRTGRSNVKAEESLAAGPAAADPATARRIPLSETSPDGVAQGIPSRPS